MNQAVLAGENLLNGLGDALMRFRLEKYACVTDVSKCFFQIKLPRSQQDWFHIIWFKKNDIDGGETKVFRFTRHVWGMNSSPYVALSAFKRLVAENPTGASQITLNAVTQNRYMDDLLLAGDTLLAAETFAGEGLELFQSRGFKLRKWESNGPAKPVLLLIPQCDHASSVGRIDIGLQPLPDSLALGLTWDSESDTLKVSSRKFVEATARREMTSQLASQFGPLGIVSPLFLSGKLILQKVAVKRRVDRIHLVAPPSSWKYVNTLSNPADVGTRELGVKQSAGSLAVWMEGPSFLKSERVEVKPAEHAVVVHRTLCGVDSILEQHDAALDKLIEASPNLYILKKRCAYLFAFVQFVIAKTKKVAVKKLVLDATYLHSAFIKVVEYVQSRCFGAVVDCLGNDTPDNFEHILKRLSAKAKDLESTRRLNELKTLCNLRPCVGSDKLLRVEGRLENADLPLDTIHPIILPGRHSLTALVVLAEHEVAEH